MFDLEPSISKWRKQMLAAGIKSPTPLNELEIHLREEIERQMKSGLNEQEAFNFAIQQIGRGGLLKMEFAKTDGFPTWFNRIKFINTMIKKIGIGLALAALFAAAILQLAGASLVVHMSKTIHQNENKMVDNWWQPQWYAFMLLGFFVAGIVLAALTKQKNPEMAAS